MSTSTMSQPEAPPAADAASTGDPLTELRPTDRARLGTRRLLGAIAEHGRNWPAVIGPEFDQRIIDAAMSREHMYGNLIDGITLSPQGLAVLASAGPVDGAAEELPPGRLPT